MRRTIIILGLLTISAVLISAAIGGGPSEPKSEPFKSGQLDFGVDGPDGQPIICKNGKELRVKKQDLLGEKPPPPGQLKKEGLEKENGKTKVWRCGKGADPDQNPVLVDAEQ
jgi:hypothetical protein